MSFELPQTSGDVLSAVRAEYTAAQQKGGDSFRDAEYRLAWALVHSPHREDVEVGEDIAKQLISVETDRNRDAEYYLAVAYYKLGKYVGARRQIAQILEKWPDFRQAERLKALADEKVMREGLIGVGIAGAAVVGIGAVAAGVLSMMAKR